MRPSLIFLTGWIWVTQIIASNFYPIKLQGKLHSIIEPNSALLQPDIEYDGHRSQGKYSPSTMPINCFATKKISKMILQVNCKVATTKARKYMPEYV